jgi:ATP-binding cassette subfamily B multidrug efflux pump
MLKRFSDWLESRIDVFAPFDERRTPPDALGRFIAFYLRGVRGYLFVVLLSALLLAGVESVLLIGVGRFVDLLSNKKPAEVWEQHSTLLIAIGLVLLILRPVANIINEGVINQVVVPQLTNRIRWRTHLYTLGHSLSYFQGDFAGRLANRITQVGPALRDVAVETLDIVVFVATYALVILAAFSTVSLWLALPMLLWMAGYVVLMRYFVPEAQKRSLKVSKDRSILVGRIVDSYTNILTVKLFARADMERSSVRSAMARHLVSYLSSMRVFTITKGVLVLLNTLLALSTAILSLWLWSRGQMTPGEIAAGLALVLRIGDMSGWFMQVLRGIFDNVGVVQESMETVSRPHAVVDAPDAKPLVVRTGEVRFENVTFHYGREEGVFEGLSLTVRPGEKVGLVGPSGAGKSTFVNLLLRLHDLEGGRILIDGQDIARVTQDSLREAVAVVTQDTSLLHRSIRDNIAYGNPGAEDRAIEEAAELAHAQGFIPQLEDHKGRRGYDARVGERGVKLSGGQRQRIAIARVILKDAPILVLDEATSALDSEVEAAIQESLAGLMQGKTVIAIAHRLSTIAALDRLIVMEGGRIIEEGTHADLLERGGLYARLWARQSGGFLGGEPLERNRKGEDTPVLQPLKVVAE